METVHGVQTVCTMVLRIFRQTCASPTSFMHGQQYEMEVSHQIKWDLGRLIIIKNNEPTIYLCFTVDLNAFLSPTSACSNKYFMDSVILRRRHTHLLVHVCIVL